MYFEPSLFPDTLYLCWKPGGGTPISRHYSYVRPQIPPLFWRVQFPNPPVFAIFRSLISLFGNIPFPTPFLKLVRFHYPLFSRNLRNALISSQPAYIVYAASNYFFSGKYCVLVLFFLAISCSLIPFVGYVPLPNSFFGDVPFLIPFCSHDLFHNPPSQFWTSGGTYPPKYRSISRPSWK